MLAKEMAKDVERKKRGGLPYPFELTNRKARRSASEGSY